jgi:hypothetical protein
MTWFRPSPRQDAKRDGLTRYLTSKPCKQGHLAERYTKDGACVICTKIKLDKYRELNRDLVNERRRASKETNRKSTARWIKANSGVVNAWNKKRYASKKQRTPAWLTSVDFERMENEYRLAALQTKITKTIWHVDHIIPLQGENVCGLHVPTNLKAIPGMDNLRKSNRYAL